MGEKRGVLRFALPNGKVKLLHHAACYTMRHVTPYSMLHHAT